MDINIYVNQKKINPLCSSAIAEYVKRLSPYCNMKIVCAPGHVKYTRPNTGISKRRFIRIWELESRI